LRLVPRIFHYLLYPNVQVSIWWWYVIQIESFVEIVVDLRCNIASVELVLKTFYCTQWIAKDDEFWAWLVDYNLYSYIIFTVNSTIMKILFSLVKIFFWFLDFSSIQSNLPSVQPPFSIKISSYWKSYFWNFLI